MMKVRVLGVIVPTTTTFNERFRMEFVSTRGGVRMNVRKRNHAAGNQYGRQEQSE